MPQELSETFYYGAGENRLRLAYDIVDRILNRLAHKLDEAPTSALREQLLRDVRGALLSHGAHCS
jgi:hypothetical protein